MPVEPMHDVLVIGCGPVGAVLANLLGRLGLRVAVAERAEEIYDKPRAITADHEMLRALQLCGFGDRLPGMVAPHPGSDYLGGDGELIKSLDPMPPPFPLGWLPVATFVQPDIEAMLRDGLRRFPAVELLTGWEAAAPAATQAGAVATLTHAVTGAIRQISARFAVACDGAGSRTRKALGIGLEDLAFDEWWMVVDTFQRGTIELPAKCVQYCWPERPATFIRGPGALRRWEIKLLPGEDPVAFGQPGSVRRQLARFTDPDALELWRSAVYRFHALVATAWRQGPVFLMGDAAHQTPPFMGQGLCAGVRDALNLAWKLAAVLRGQAGDTLLDSYEAERKPHFRTIVALTKELGRIIGELDPAAARQRDATLRAEMAAGRAQTVRNDLIPDFVDGLVDRDETGAPRRPAGSPFIQPHVWAGDTPRLLDDVAPPGFLLVTAGAGPQHWAGPAGWPGARIAIGEPEPALDGVLLLRETAGLFAGWMARHGAGAVIVRPDRCVFGTARDAAGLSRLLHSLAAQMAAPPRFHPPVEAA